MSTETDEITLEQAQAVIEAEKARTPAGALDMVRKILSLPAIEHIDKHGREGNLYVLHLDDGTEVELGSAKQLFKRIDFDAAIMAQTRHLPPDRKPATHRQLVGWIERAATQRNNVASTTEETEGWIAAYAEAVRLEHVDRNDTARMWATVGSARSFWDTTGRLYLRPADLCMFLKSRMSIQVNTQELSVRLSQLGFDKPDDGGQVAVRKGQQIQKARYWVSQPGYEVER